MILFGQAKTHIRAQKAKGHRLSPGAALWRLITLGQEARREDGAVPGCQPSAPRNRPYLCHPSGHTTGLHPGKGLSLLDPAAPSPEAHALVT